MATFMLTPLMELNHVMKYQKRQFCIIIGTFALVLLFTAARLTAASQLAITRPGSRPPVPTPTVPGSTAPSPLVSLANQIIAGDWPSYTMDNGRSGFNSEESMINPATAGHLLHFWTYHTGGAISAQPVEANGLIYWGSWDGLEHATYLNGKQAWATNLGQTTDDNCAPASVGVASTATVATITSNGTTTATVFVGGGNGNFYALNAANGKVIWSTFLGNPPAHFIWGSPVVYNGSVYVGMASFGDCPAVQGQLFQMSMTTGAIQHVFNVVPDGCRGGGIWSSPTIDNATGKLYVSTGSKDACGTNESYTTSLVELRASDLSFVSSWQTPPSRQVNDSDFGSSPTLFTARIGGVSRSLVGVSHKNGNYYAFLQNAIGDGPVWSVNIANAGDCPECGDGSISSSAWDGSKLYVAGGSTTINGDFCPGSLRALDPASGAFVWEHCLPDGPVLGPVTGAPGLLAVGEGSGLVVMSAASGKTLFTYRDRNGASFQGAPSISHGMLYAGNADGNLYAFGTFEELMILK